MTDGNFLSWFLPSGWTSNNLKKLITFFKLIIYEPCVNLISCVKDKRAKVNHDPSNMGDMCDRLLCRLDESGANGYFAAGPALEGTACRNASGQNNDYFCIQVIQFANPNCFDVDKVNFTFNFQGGCIQRTDIRDLIISATAPTPKPPSQASGTATTALTSVAPAQPQWGPWKYESCYTGNELNK